MEDVAIVDRMVADSCFNGATLSTAWKTLWSPTRSRRISRFNGATLSKRGRHLADRVVARHRSFNGATLSKRGRRRSTLNLRRVSSSFNGATLSTAWKTSITADRVHGPGGLQWGHAEHSVEDARRPRGRARSSTCFNGATLSTAWKTAYPCIDRLGRSASMGPR